MAIDEVTIYTIPLRQLSITTQIKTDTSTMQPIKILFPAMLIFGHAAHAGPVAYGLCQAGCAAVVTACYAAGGATWGVTGGASVPPTIVACDSAFGACQAACWAAVIAPTP
ncbi:hypothetical protein P8C59_007522 [Phyllachora maydis]|uniref:Uncharacterized protein n=1 Tax=Phyllachora maydis TaxID=1825666 RepID=A0AAD9IAH7_9PEZI|nr:hypothetical protein P8C59_007522 [Phyllachora maydis]